jgi:hypothetical protein
MCNEGMQPMYLLVNQVKANKKPLQLMLVISIFTFVGSILLGCVRIIHYKDHYWQKMKKNLTKSLYSHIILSQHSFKTGQIKTSKSDFPPLFHVLHKEQRTNLMPTVSFVIPP